ncbi:MAG: hypothetical protein AAB074_17650 [Planctomycetota bacterium]
MKHSLAVLAFCASAACAQPGEVNLPNPARLGDRRTYETEGLSFQAPEGCIILAADGADGQRAIAASRLVRVDGQDLKLGLQLEVFSDLDLATYRRIVEGLQGALGLTTTTVDEATRDGRLAWRADLSSRQGEPVTHVLVVDAGDRIIVVSWAPRDAVAREFSALLDESVRSLKVVPRVPIAASEEPTEEWAPANAGVKLKAPAGWRNADRGEARALRNPRDRFENLAFGLLEGTVQAKAADWEKLKLDRTAAASCVEGREETWRGRKSFVCRSRLAHQGIPVANETRLIEHRGRLVFVSMTSREDRFEDRRKLLDAVLGTLALEE